MKTYKSTLPELSLKYKSGEFKRIKCETSNDVYCVVKEMYDQDTIEYNESVILLFLNCANNTIGWSRHTTGGTAQTIVDVKMILTESLLCGASGLIISHNHPSGQLYASEQDKQITKKLKIGCDAIGIKLLDHIIVGGDKSGYYSFSDEGLL